MEKLRKNTKPINVVKFSKKLDINRFSSYERKFINIENKLWDSPSPNFSFDTHQLGRDTIPPPIGKTPPNTPENLKFLNFLNNDLIKNNNFIKSPKNKVINNNQNNQDDIFNLEM